METVDKKRLFSALRRRIWIIILTAVVAAAGFFGVTRFFVTPLYEASIKMYVNNSSISVGGTSFSISSSELTAAQSLVDTYIVILQSYGTIDEVIRQSGVSHSHEAVSGMISAAPINDTEIFSITVTSPSPEETELIANTIATVLPSRIAQIVDGSSVRVVEYARVPTQRSSPSYIKNGLFGFVIGAVFSITAVLFFELMDDKLRSEDYLTANYRDIPLLAVIPDAQAASGSSYYRSSYYKTEAKDDDK